MSLFSKSPSKASKSSKADDNASIASTAASEITLVKEHIKKTSQTSLPKRNPSATKADPNRSWEARSYALM
ncbi:hypothetical protein LIA77_11683 [Sarocladium implicatum]|nr:hypothetical protein LIA77_11683 [Sarocladium implicatum]